MRVQSFTVNWGRDVVVELRCRPDDEALENIHEWIGREITVATPRRRWWRRTASEVTP